MATITDPEVLAFSDTYARRLATLIRDLRLAGNELVTEYTLSIAGNAAFVAAADGDTIGDQNGTGQPYTKADLVAMAVVLQQILDGNAGFESAGGLNGAGVMDEILALVVRAYQG